MSLFDKPFDPAREAALVTGAGNGIGRAIAQALVGEGVRTVFADVNRETVTAAATASAHPELAVPWVGDLADPDARAALLAQAAAAVGQVTHFVHSASPPRRLRASTAPPAAAGRGCPRPARCPSLVMPPDELPSPPVRPSAWRHRRRGRSRPESRRRTARR